MIKYLGSKRTLLEQIGSVVGAFPQVESVADIFSGTARVGHHLKGSVIVSPLMITMPMRLRWQGVTLRQIATTGPMLLPD